MKLQREKIELILARKQLSVKEVCEMSGLSKETFKQAKNGARNATPKTIGRIAAALGVQVEDIIETEGDKQMNTRDKLNLMDEVNAANLSHIMKFREEGKNCKRWKVEYAGLTADGNQQEDSFDVSAPTIADALSIGQELLDKVAPSMGWVRWMVWNLGIYEDELF